MSSPAGNGSNGSGGGGVGPGSPRAVLNVDGKDRDTDGRDSQVGESIAAVCWNSSIGYKVTVNI
jgi:hypothetical protein